MKIQLNTSIWETEDTEKVKYKLRENFTYTTFIAIALIIAPHIYPYRIIAYVLGTLFGIRGILAILSYNQHAKRKQNG